MNIFKLIHFKCSGSLCMGCKWFQNDPAHIENAYPGLTSMSSGYASVRDKDGFCEFHQLYLSAKDSCDYFIEGKALSENVMPY